MRLTGDALETLGRPLFFHHMRTKMNKWRKMCVLLTIYRRISQDIDAVQSILCGDMRLLRPLYCKGNISVSMVTDLCNSI